MSPEGYFGYESQYSFADCRKDCGKAGRVDQYPEHYGNINWSRHRPSRDLRGVVDLLKALNLAKRRLLHIGVGGSYLAKKLAKRTGGIDGITISPKETELARSLKLPNYHVYCANKHYPDLVAIWKQGEYDYVVDNNLASFVCCHRHFRAMMDNYYQLLKRGGELITHFWGMDWVDEQCKVDSRWRLSIKDLHLLALEYDYQVISYPRSVYSLLKK